MKKLILITDVAFWENDVGSKLRISRLIEHLAQQRLRLFVVILGFKQQAIELEAGNAVSFIFFKEPLPMRLARTIMRLTSKLFSPAKPFFPSFYFKKMVSKCIRSINPDFVLIEYLRLSYLVEGKNRPYLCLLDTIDLLHSRYKRFLHFKISGAPRITEETELEMLNEYDYVITISQSELHWCKNRILGKSICVPYQQKVLSFTERTGGKRLGFIGSAAKHNIDSMTYFFEHIYSLINEQFELFIAGDICSFLPKYKQGVNLMNHLTDVTDFYATIDVVINPIRAGSGLKIKNVEALCYGFPLITTPIGAEGIEDGSGSAFLEASTERDFSRCIDYLLSDLDAQKKLSLKAHRYAQEKFSSTSVYRQLDEVLL